MVVIGLRVAILVPATLAAFALVQGPSLPGVAIVLALLAVLVAFERLALRPAAVRDASRCDDE